MNKPVEGFSKLTKDQKIDWLTANYTQDPENAKELLHRYWNTDAKIQQLHDEFIENTITNYYLPFGIAPNFLINDKLYAIPMAIEESSVVAAAVKLLNFGFLEADSKRPFWVPKKLVKFILCIPETPKNLQVSLNR